MSCVVEGPLYLARGGIAASGKIQGSLDAERDANVCIALCTKGSLHYGGKKNAASRNISSLETLTIQVKGRYK